MNNLKDKKLAEIEESIRRSEDLLKSNVVDGPAKEYFEKLLVDSIEELIEITMLDSYGE